ncbi:MAG TPA: hypothetical protein VFR33_07420 [Candidatus Dormibacteraeota bacterium]|nr:hypothetical protein [Candidatus Dormibacteraeota bacterium]
MSRTRALIVVGLLVVFVIAGGVVMSAVSQHGGKARTFDVVVTHAATMVPDTLKANQNDTVTINVHSDVTGEVHLHVYDIAFSAVAGQVVSRTFKADKTCSCDLEWESTAHPLGVLVVSP